MFQLSPNLSTPALSVAVAALAAIAVAHVSLRWVARRLVRHYAADAHWPTADESRWRRWLARGVDQMFPPIAALIWVNGIGFLIRLFIQAKAPQAVTPGALLGLGWAYGISLLAAVVWLLWRAGGMIEIILLSIAARAQTSWDDVVLPLAGKTVRRALPLLGLILGAPAVPVSPALVDVVRNATSLSLIAVVALILCQLVDASAALVLRHHRIDVADNLQARAIHTQVMVLKRVALTVIGLLALASMMMVFESVRQFGASILASAGVAGIVVGLAAQRSIATLLAGFQVAMTQPIRVDDVVIVENEFGRVEDITLTYVVVRVWDLRRLIVPMTYFIERPFQNWTRASADMLCTVHLYLDYSVPVEPLRRELTRILEQSPRWDRRVNILQITDAREHTVELRALASAADASQAWDLRCDIRERLIAFVQQHFPDSLPRMRATFVADPAERQPAPPTLAGAS